MEIKNKVLIHNRFDIEVRDSVTNELKKSVVAYNIVLNQMYTRLCGGSSYFANIHFGSGTGTLSPTRTSLFSHLGTKTAVDDTLVKSIPLSTWKRKIVLNPEEYVGNTISEVGVAFGATNTNLVTHSLLKDSEGNPISIVKTDTDVITIYATVFVTFDDSNPNLVYLGMPSGNALVNYLIGGGSAPTGAFSLSDIFLSLIKLWSSANVTWTSDTVAKQRKTNVQRFGTTVGNGQVKFLEFANVFSLEFPYSSVFNGQAYSGVTLGTGDGVKTDFRLPSANIKEDTLVVKVNGVITTAYTIEDFIGGFRTLKSLNEFPSSSVGYGIALSRNGNVCAIKLYNTTVFDIFEKILGVWTRRNSPPAVPLSIAKIVISDDGSVVAVSSSNTSVVVFRWDGSAWSSSTITNSVKGVTISGDGNIIAISFDYGTNAKVYDWNGSAWVVRSATISIGTSYGGNCLLSQDGLCLIITNNTAPYIHIFDWNGSAWVKRANMPNLLTSFGFMSMSNDKQYVAVAQEPTGSNIAVYQWDGSTWTQYGSFSATGYLRDLKISNDGKFLVVCAMNYTMRVYEYYNGSWLTNIVVSSNDANVPSNIDFISPNYIYCSGFSSFNCLVVPALDMKSILFTTPPAISDVITADYTVDGVHKTDQYVIDVSMAIQFGEVV